MNAEHEPPRFARSVLSVSRADGAWNDVVERMLPEHCAVHAMPPPRRKAGDDPCGGAGYARPSNRRACMPYGATEANTRDEERDCPTLLEIYRAYTKTRTPTTDRSEMAALSNRIFGAVDRAIEKNDVRRLLVDWIAGDEPGMTLLRRAFAAWIDTPMFRAILAGDPCDREFRRRKASSPRPPFASLASVLSAAGGQATLGMGSITLERVAESKGRTRANWDEVDCKETRSMSGSVKSLAAVEREIDASTGLRGIGLSGADVRGILDAAERLPLEERLLSYRAELAGWAWKREDKVVQQHGEVEAVRRAMQEARRDILKATAHISDGEIRKAIKRAKERAAVKLRGLTPQRKDATRNQSERA